MPQIRPITDLRNTTEISELCHAKIEELEKAIFSLEQFPERGTIRRIGVYSNGDYQQLFVKNYVVIYRVFKKKKDVHIITIRYTSSNF